MSRTTRAAIDTTFRLETPEQISFSYQLAGPGQRLFAYGIDLCVRGLIVVLYFFAMALMAPVLSFDDLVGAELGALLFIFFLLEWGYFVFFETLMRGASPGKKALRLRVIRESGLPVTFRESLLRNLLRAADLLPTLYAIGALSVLFDKKFRRLGDLVARTLVVVEEKASQPLHSSSQKRKEPMLALPPRPHFRREERAALLLFARRAPELSEARARELAEIWAPQLRERFNVPGADALLLLHTLAASVER